MGTNEFAALLSENYERVNELISSYYAERLETMPHPDAMRYLYGPLSHYAANGGKRHRPVVCMLGCAAVGGDPLLATSAAIAVEHFHAAALIHDDIADEGELRHGEPCLHLTVGVGLAVNCGDLALSQVTGTVLKDDRLADAVKVRVLGELVDMTTRTIEGQALDIGWAGEGRWDIGPDDYLTMASLKTAYYSVAIPLACGAIVGGGTEEQIEALRSFGLSTGLAFQLQDDLLNLVGGEESKKKDFRSDITEGKRTLAAVYALADPTVGEELRAILGSHTSDPAQLQRAVDLMEQAGAIDRVRSYSLQLTREAKDGLREIDLVPKYRDMLMSMADFFVERLA